MLARAHMRVSHEVAWCASSVLHIRLLHAFFQYVEVACIQLSPVFAMLAVPGRVARYTGLLQRCVSLPRQVLSVSAWMAPD